VAVCTLGIFSSAFASDKKLTDDDKIQLLRGLTAEFATVKTYLPRSKKPLPFQSDGTWDKKQWEDMGRELGPAARVGDSVQITKVNFEDDKIVFEINGGTRGKGNWKDHVQIGLGVPTGPVNPTTNAPSGTNLALLFNKLVPPITADQVKKILAPVLDFEKETATESYVEKLPEPVQKAIKQNKAIEGMDRDQVLLALGKPRHKERSTQDGADLEDWIYGDPPGKITFVTFTGSKVSKVKEAYANIGGSTAIPNGVH